MQNQNSPTPLSKRYNSHAITPCGSSIKAFTEALFIGDSPLRRWTYIASSEEESVKLNVVVDSLTNGRIISELADLGFDVTIISRFVADEQ